MVIKSTNYQVWNNDDGTHVSTVLSIQTNNYGSRKYPKRDDNIDDKERKVGAVQKGLLVDMHVFTKSKISITRIRSRRGKGSPPSSVAKLVGDTPVAELAHYPFLHNIVYDGLLAMYSDHNNNSIR